MVVTVWSTYITDLHPARVDLLGQLTVGEDFEFFLEMTPHELELARP
jgi:hypothetical protein